MDNSCPLILEISSGEESGFIDARGGDFTGDGDRFGVREDHEWLSKLLGEVDGDKDDDSDEVLLVSEVISNPKKSRLQSSKLACEIVCGGDEDDDDCVILECQPDRARVVKSDGVDNRGGGGDGDDSDDLEIVGEKGEVACRDFPHARHLCANFAFVSTRHNIHCSQCHCYVCDSLAPCAHWGTGISSSDHCHANDKEDYWKTERKRAKKRIPGTIDTYFSTGLPQMTQVPAPLPPLPNSFLQNQAFRQVPCRPCSKSSTVNVPIAINQNRSHLAGRVIPRYKNHAQYSHQRLHATWHSDTTSMGGNSNTGNRVPQFIHRPALKRPRFVEALPNSRHGYNRRYYRSQVSRGSPLKFPGLNNGNGFNHLKNTGHCAANPVLSPPDFLVPQSMNVGLTNYIHSYPQIHSLPNSNYVVGGPMHSQPDMPSQPYLGDNFENGVPFHSQVLSPANSEVLADTASSLLDQIFQPNFPVYSQSMLSTQLDSNSEYGKQMHCTPTIPSHPNQSSQFQEFGEHTSLHISQQNTYHRSSQAQSVVLTGHAEFGVNWDTSLSHDNVRSATSADDFQRHGMTENDCNIVPANSFYPESVPPADSRLLGADNGHHFDNWITENPSFPVDFEVSPMSPGLSVFSPEHSSMDAGTRLNNVLQSL